MKKEFLDVFQSKKPIFGMLHLKGTSDAEVMERAKKEIHIYYENGVRGPVTIQSAFSVDPIDIESIQITKSVNSETSHDTMGMKHRVNFALYTVKGSINHQLAEKTGFSDEDAEKIKEALRTLFENDASSARPDGSMEVVKVYWWKHNCPMGQYSSAKVHRLLKIEKKTEFPKNIDDYEITLDSLPGLEVEIIEGI